MEVDQPAPPEKTDTSADKKPNGTSESNEATSDQNENTTNSSDKTSKEGQDESSDSTPPKPPETEQERLVKDAQLSTAAAAALGAAAVKAKVRISFFTYFVHLFAL